MKYEMYIRLGFKRYDSNDWLEFNETGYGGFSLEKVINDKLSICVTSGNLDSPKLYIKKMGQDAYHIINIPTEAVVDLLHGGIECKLVDVLESDCEF